VASVNGQLSIVQVRKDKLLLGRNIRTDLGNANSQKRSPVYQCTIYFSRKENLGNWESFVFVGLQ
jgi:hypothetical protein